jgi:glucose/arabinose dehydrogenase
MSGRRARVAGDRRRRFAFDRSRLVVVLLALLLAAPETWPPSAHAHVLRDPALVSVVLVSGLEMPTSMAFIGPDDILVLQKEDGRVRRVIGGVLQPGAVLDVAVDSASERGLLGIVVHPQFPSTPFVYLYFTESSTGGDTIGAPAPAGNRVYRFIWDGATLRDRVLILDLPVLPGPNHNAGVMAFGPDGRLYVVIGDLNHGGQLQNIASGPPPDDTGVVLRVNDDGTVPPDNPFFALGGNAARYFAYGLRNSFGLAFDPLTGRLWMTENGPDRFDEINLVEPGFNGGWNQILGPDVRDPEGEGDLFQLAGSQYADPKFSWLATVAPTGMAFLDSASLGAAYEDDLILGAFNTGTLYRFRFAAGRDRLVFSSPSLADLVADTEAELDELIFGTGFGGVTDVRVGPDGRLYVLSLPEGVIHVVSRPEASLSRTSSSSGSAAALAVSRPRIAESFPARSTMPAVRPAPPGISLPAALSVAADHDGSGGLGLPVSRRTAAAPIGSIEPTVVDHGEGRAGAALKVDLGATRVRPPSRRSGSVPGASVTNAPAPVGAGKPPPASALVRSTQLIAGAILTLILLASVGFRSSLFAHL